MCTHVRKIFWKVSSNSEHHSKPTMNINSQHHNLLGNQIGGFLYLTAILYLGYHVNGRHFEIFQPPPKSCHILRCIFYSYKVDHNMAPKPWISIPNIKIYLETKFFPNRRIFLFWWPFWIQNGRHSKPSMNINLQHHNLLGNQISPKAEEFCILDTMATATILNFFNTPKSCHTLRWIFLQSFMKGIQIFF